MTDKATENQPAPQPLWLGSTEGLGLEPERARFEAWARACPQYRFWNTSDAAYAAWCHGVAAERERLQRLIARHCDACVAAVLEDSMRLGLDVGPNV